MTKRHFFRCAWVIIVLPSAAVPVAADESSSYVVGTAAVDVTPGYPIRLSGYGSRTSESTGVEQRLWAKAMAVGNADDRKPLVLITVDTIGVPDMISAAIAERLQRAHGIPRENLAVCASHTHSAPAHLKLAPLILAPPSEGEQSSVAERERATIARYTAELTTAMGDAAERALADMRPARLKFAVGRAEFAVNRRVVKDGKWIAFGPVADAPVDHALPTLFVYDRVDETKLRAVLINYACHCTTLSGNYMKIHGDWAGCFQEQFEHEFPGTTAMVAIGCGADANPNPRNDDSATVRAHGDTLVREVKRLLGDPKAAVELTGRPEAQRTEFVLPLAPPPSRAEFERRAQQKGPIARHAQRNLERLDRGETLPTTVPYSAQTWAFGDRLAMVFLPGEVVVDYQLRLKREFDAARLWVNAYANAAPCYIASRRILAEGGYEVDQSMYYYDQPQHFAPEVEERLIAGVHAVVPRRFSASTRFEKQVEEIEARDGASPPPQRSILFLGSSTIRLWKLGDWFPDLPVVNHGFGGSQIADSIYYFDRLVMPLEPRQIVFFAGGNDLNAGKSPDEVYADFVRFAALVRQRLPQTRLTYLAVTPSVKRWSQIETQRAVNARIEATIREWKSPLVEFVPNAARLLDAEGRPQPSLYVEDRLHLNEAGYRILSDVVRPHLK